MKDTSGRREARRRYPLSGKCERCGGSAAERHHKDRDPTNNERGNIEFLCADCHGKEHRTTDYHGTLNGYNVYQCRCGLCRNCHSQYLRERRAARKRS